MKSKVAAFTLTVCCTLLAVAVPALAQDAKDGGPEADLLSPYVGQDAREIPTLSEDDVRQLENGEGWGLAKAAELNGIPGPAHLLEMFEHGAIQLTGEQVERIRSLHKEMKEQAIPLGLKLIEQERELNRRFAAVDLGEEDLAPLLAGIAATTAELRYVHLSTHLRTLPVLTAHQVQTYNSIRGYSVGAPGPSAEHAHSAHMHQP